MSKEVDRSILEIYLKSLYREVLEFYKYGLPLSGKAIESIISTMLKPPKGFFKAFQSEEMSRALIASHKIRKLSVDLRRVIEDATRYLVTKRSFEYEESQSLKGAIVWTLTVKNMLSFRPPVIVTYTRALSEAEYMLLKSLILKAIDILEVSKSGLSTAFHMAKQNPLVISSHILAPRSFITLASYVLSEVEKFLTDLKLLVKQYPLEFIHVPRNISWIYIEKLIKVIKSKPWRPKWVNEAIDLGQSIKGVEENIKSLRNIVEIMHKRTDVIVIRDVSNTVRFLAFRLYEIYTYMVTLAAVLKMFKGSIEEIRGRSTRVRYDYGKSIIVVYGRKPGKSMLENAEARWLTGEVLNKDELKNLAGKPDIGVYNEVKVVIEAKFSNTLHYLTQARFKALAYIYEYNADAGILVYPGPITGRGMDSEERYTRKILDDARKKGGLEITLATGKKLIILPMSPTETEVNIEKMTRILASLLS
jgi:hypothetical protein